MKNSIFLLGWVLMFFLRACSDNEASDFILPQVTIESIDGATACMPGELIHLRAKIDKKIPMYFSWSITGEEVSTDSLYTFSAIEVGNYLVTLKAIYSDGVVTDSLMLSVQEVNANFSIYQIKNWTGNGEQQAALAIQWVKGKQIESPTDEEVLFLAWGYRWPIEHQATSEEMLKAIVKQDARLYVILAEQWNGCLVKGLGYDGNNDGKISIKNGTLNLTEANFKDGIYWQKLGESVDDFELQNDADFWMGGWEVAYATLWIGSGVTIPKSDEFDYSNYAPNLRVLSNNAWDVWTYSTINETERNVFPIPRLLKAAAN